MGGIASSGSSRSGAPADVRIEVFTVSGRRILEMEGTARVGYNSVMRDRRDAEGPRVANGLCLYVVTSKNVEGREISESGKIVKVEQERAWGSASVALSLAQDYCV